MEKQYLKYSVFTILLIKQDSDLIEINIIIVEKRGSRNKACVNGDGEVSDS